MKFDFINDYEFNLLNIENLNTSRQFEFLFRFIKKNHNKIEGDIFEFGTFQGRTLLALAILLKKINSKKKIFAFDSFKGFPTYSKQDSFSNFRDLFMKKKITKRHYEQITTYKKILMFKNNKKNFNPKFLLNSTISAKNDFSETSKKSILNKINKLKLKNINIIDGPFEKSVGKFFKSNPRKIFACNIDCDLYSGYKTILPYIYKHLEKGGYVHLDEYYSLKYPGARIACNEFFESNNIIPKKNKTNKNEFERWFFTK